MPIFLLLFFYITVANMVLDANANTPKTGVALAFSKVDISKIINSTHPFERRTDVDPGDNDYVEPMTNIEKMRLQLDIHLLSGIY